MYKKLLVGLVAFMIMLSVPGFVLAVSDDTSQNTATDQSTDASSTDVKLKDQKTRIDGYKTRATERLSSADEKRVSGVCTTAQQRLEKVKSSSSEAVLKRQEKLASVTKRLKELSIKLKKASTDTTQLDAMIVGLESKAAEMVTTFEGYQQTLQDSSTIDCATDPSGFKASLEAARIKRAEIRTESDAIKLYVNETIKPQLEEVKKSLVQSTAESE